MISCKDTLFSFEKKHVVIPNLWNMYMNTREPSYIMNIQTGILPSYRTLLFLNKKKYNLILAVCEISVISDFCIQLL